MKLLATTAAAAAVLISGTGAAPSAQRSSGDAPDHVFANPQSAESYTSNRIPTAYESAVLGRRMLALTPLGTLATVFPSDPATFENRPAGLGGMPHGLMEYIADCETGGNPTMLAINVETSFKNIAAGSNVSLSVRWTPPNPPSKRIKSAATSPVFGGVLRLFGHHHNHHDHHRDSDPVPYSAANLPRFSLLGYVEPIPGGDDLSSGAVGAELASCFVDAHQDARIWLPGSRVHESHFVRLVVQHVYWIGGFGDRAYIGWISADGKPYADLLFSPLEKKGHFTNPLELRHSLAERDAR
jgi:hypothetical protein